MKFNIIVIDPPFSFSDNLKMSDVKRGAEDNYATMSFDEIKKLKIKEISDSNGCLLALWVPSSMLKEGLDLMDNWGFDHKQTYIWVKIKKEPLNNLFINIKNKIKSFSVKEFLLDLKKQINSVEYNNILSFGMGRLFRQSHEICLIGINNKNIYKSLKNKSQRSVCFAFNKKHSTKPEALQDSLEKMFPDTEDKKINKIEVFARRKRDKWICVGNEVCEGEDIRASLEKIIKEPIDHD